MPTIDVYKELLLTSLEKEYSKWRNECMTFGNREHCPRRVYVILQIPALFDLMIKAMKNLKNCVSILESNWTKWWVPLGLFY